MFSCSIFLGLQIGYYLEKNGRDYIIYERDPTPGTVFIYSQFKFYFILQNEDTDRKIQLSRYFLLFFSKIHVVKNLVVNSFQIILQIFMVGWTYVDGKFNCYATNFFIAVYYYQLL